MELQGGAAGGDERGAEVHDDVGKGARVEARHRQALGGQVCQSMQAVEAAELAAVETQVAGVGVQMARADGVLVLSMATHKGQGVQGGYVALG